jgi:hypothetical protein
MAGRYPAPRIPSGKGRIGTRVPERSGCRELNGPRSGYGVPTMREWLPRVPLALVACARVLLLHGEVSRASGTRLEWPAINRPARVPPALAAVVRPAP